MIKTHTPNCSMEKLIEIFSTASQITLDEFYYSLEYAYYFGIVTEQDEDFFLATVYSEVGSSLIPVRESLNYACDSLIITFSYYAGYLDEAQEDGRCDDHDADQVTIGNKAYGSRLGNGDVDSGDGYMFRGFSFIQITGRYNAQSVVDDVNDKVETSYTAEQLANGSSDPFVASLGSMGWWAINDVGDCESMDEVTNIVNYYTESRDERNETYEWIATL